MLFRSHERLDSNPFLIINGLGGIGKTTTTHEYIKRYKSDYNAIIVMNECDMKSNFYYNLRLLVEEGSFSSALKDKELSDEDIQNLILQKLKGNCFEKVLLVFDNVDTDESIGYIKPYLQELSTLDSIHIMITSRIQSARVFSEKLFPNDKDDVMDIASCIYTVQKLSLCVSRRLMLKRLNLDENEMQELTEEGNQLLQAILNHFDGLPLALIQASGTLSDDLAKMRIKEGQLTKDNVNLVFQNYLDTYHEIFFNSEDNEHYRLDVESNFDDLEFRRREYYENNVVNNANFQFLEDKIGVTTFEDYLEVLNFSESDWKECQIIPLHRRRFNRLIYYERFRIGLNRATH